MDARSRTLVMRGLCTALAIYLAGFALQPNVTAAEDKAATKAGSVLDSVERMIAKEPEYTEAPKYSLLVLGPKAEAKVWMVEDGRKLYVDKNANGDLTDDGPPIEPSDLRHPESHWDYNYLLDTITPPDGSRHTEF